MNTLILSIRIIISVIQTNNQNVVIYNYIEKTEEGNCIEWRKFYSKPNLYQVGDTIQPYTNQEEVIWK